MTLDKLILSADIGERASFIFQRRDATTYISVVTVI